MRSILSYFYQWETNSPDRVFLRQPKGDEWVDLSYGQAGVIARKMAMALGTLADGKGAHIGLISKNCQHWLLADLAIMMSGNVSIPLYPSLHGDELRDVLEKSDTKILFVGKLDDWEVKRNSIPEHIEIIRFPHYDGFAKIEEGHDWDELLNSYEKMDWNYEPGMEDLWTILYTSGTTGSPKGVMHTHGNAAALMISEMKHNALGGLDVDYPAYFSFLPLNHIAERAAIELMAIMTGGSVSFAENLESFSHNLQDIQPHFFFAVPRIWHKFQQAIFDRLPPERLRLLLKIPILSHIVKNKIKRSLGLIRANTVLTGASITPDPLKDWYRSVGIELREVYGLTENFGCFTLMPRNAHKSGTVGKVYPGAEGKLDPETGEILIRVPWMMTGYYNDEALTSKTLVDGWLHTGDTGALDEEGYFSIIGRLKDAFKTSKGKFIVPSVIEARFGSSELIDQICVSGLGLSQPMLLITLTETGKSKSKEQLIKIFEDKLLQLNAQLEGHDQISHLVILSESWTDLNGFLTPTLKVKRNFIQQEYAEKMLKWSESKVAILFEK